MSYRDIAVLVDDKRPSVLRAEAAAALAARTGARLTGVFMRSDFLRTAAVGEGLAFMPPDAFDRAIQQQADAVNKAAEEARAVFIDAARAAGVEHDWREVDGDRDEAMIGCARLHDLTVFPAVAEARYGQNTLSAGHLGMGSGAPVLVLPWSGYEPTFGKSIMVAWKRGARESARALRDAMPLLAIAEQVTVLEVSNNKTLDDPWLERYLERNGVKANLLVNPRTDDHTNEILHLEMGKTGSDTLVMGLYGKPRVQQLIMGGVSRSLLNDPPFPILASH